MGRSVKKGPFIHPKLLKKVLAQKESGEHKPIRTWARASVISPDFVSHTLEIHNGRTFTKLFVTEEMVGHRLGEFALTRTFRGHSGGGKK